MNTLRKTTKNTIKDFPRRTVRSRVTDLGHLLPPLLHDSHLFLHLAGLGEEDGLKVEQLLLHGQDGGFGLLEAGQTCRVAALLLLHLSAWPRRHAHR